MLLNIRETVRNSKPIKYTLITLICIPFALVGIGSYFSGRAAPPVAEVNGAEILPQQLESAYSQQRQRLAQMFGGRIPPGFENETMLREQALQQLITQQVVRSEVENQAFAVGDETLARSIRSIPNFQVDGQFDSDTYQRFLQGSGMSIDGFERQMRDDTAINQFRSGIASTSFTLPVERQRVEALASQIRTVDWIQYSIDDAKENIDVSDDDVSTYFDENAESYQFPERAKLAYISLDSATLADDFDVSDEEAQTYYDENRSSYMSGEGREVSHILLSLDDPGDTDAVAEKTATLNDLKTRIEAGEDFGALAKEFSEDLGSADSGGSLGDVTPGLMEPAFEEAAFALAAVGDLSEPVASTFGVHLIKLDNIRPESGKPFDEVKDDIVSTLKRNRADDEFFALRESLAELAFDNPDSLSAVAEDTGLEVVTTDWVDAASAENSEDPVLANPAVFAAAMSDDVLIDGNNSELVEMGPNHVITVRVVEHENPRPKTLDDVRDEIVDTLKTERAGEQLDSLASSTLEKILAGEAISDLAEAEALATATEGESVDRQSTALERSVVTDVFGLAAPADAPVTHQATLVSGDRIALVLREVSTPEAEEDSETPVFNAQLGNTEFNALVESLRSQADVTVNEVNSVNVATQEADSSN